ncbi:MAG: CvpA family protein [Planctomycetota bacterium]
MIAFQAADGVVLLLLVAFGAWGAWKGSVRQIGTLLLLIAGFPLARQFGPSLESTVAKVISVHGFARQAVSWAVVYVAAVIAGGALLTALQPFLKRVRLGGPMERLLGALLGIVQGAVFLTVFGFGALVSCSGPDCPSWIAGFERSTAAKAMNGIRGGLARVVELPPWLAERVSGAAERIEG